MLKIDKLEDVRGNNVVVYSIKTLVSKGTYPKFTIMSGNMGVGKSTVARIVGDMLDESETPLQILNFGLEINMKTVEDTVFKMNPSKPRVFIFEEMHGLNKEQQTALLTMLDMQPSNIYVIGTTTELHKILPAIRSRATVWKFRLLAEKQLSQLLDDYLSIVGGTLSSQAKYALLKSCRGVPRDLLKSTDLALAGEFTESQLNELLGQISEDLIYTLLCSLKSTSIDFSVNMTRLLSDFSKDKLYQMRDFFTRYLLERKGIEGATITKEKISSLDLLFSDEELNNIGKVLVRATPDTLALELALLNMNLTRTGRNQLVGQQIDRLASNQSVSVSSLPEAEAAVRKQDASLRSTDLRSLQLK